MENKIIKLDFEDMTNEELIEIQERVKEVRLKKVENKIGNLEDINKKIKNALEILEIKNKELEEGNKIIQNKINILQDEIEGVTKTLMTHGKEKRELQNHLHRIIYNELYKESVRDELFHGDLTRGCKHYLCQELNASKFDLIKVENIDIAKELAYKFLSKENIHRIMRRRTRELLNKFDKLQSTNKKLKEKENRQLELLDELLEEVGGNADAI